MRQHHRSYYYLLLYDEIPKKQEIAVQTYRFHRHTAPQKHIMFVIVKRTPTI